MSLNNIKYIINHSIIIRLETQKIPKPEVFEDRVK